MVAEPLLLKHTKFPSCGQWFLIGYNELLIELHLTQNLLKKVNEYRTSMQHFCKTGQHYAMLSMSSLTCFQKDCSSIQD
jgi:hypothetical protein